VSSEEVAEGDLLCAEVPARTDATVSNDQHGLNITRTYLLLASHGHLDKLRIGAGPTTC
jgi:hypothetical protein